MLEFDYVIVGAGSAGCVLASRFSEDGTRTVALIEDSCDALVQLSTIPSGSASRSVMPAATSIHA